MLSGEQIVGRVYIVDGDHRRRAKIAREFQVRSLHGEIYEDLVEFGQSLPRAGIVFAADEPADGCDPRAIVALIASSGGMLPVIAYSERPTPEMIVSAIRCGAFDYLEWPFEPSLLDAAMRHVASEGERTARKAQIRALAKAKVGLLTRREREVLVSLLKGLSNQDIGKALSISPRTVEVHRSSLMRKLGARSASEATRIGLYADLDDDFGFR